MAPASRTTRRGSWSSWVRAGITGTISLMVLVGIMAFVVGVGAATYLEEFAPKNWFTRLVDANIANLAGVPSVVYGVLGAGVCVFFLGLGKSLIVGAITSALLTLPVIIVLSREALRAVPRALREAGLGLGATPLQTVGRQILPQVLPGIFTGTMRCRARSVRPRRSWSWVRCSRGGPTICVGH